MSENHLWGDPKNKNVYMPYNLPKNQVDVKRSKILENDALFHDFRTEKLGRWFLPIWRSWVIWDHVRVNRELAKYRRIRGSLTSSIWRSPNGELVCDPGILTIVPLRPWTPETPISPGGPWNVNDTIKFHTRQRNVTKLLNFFRNWYQLLKRFRID